MKVYLNSITGIDDAILSMYFSNGKWNEYIDNGVRNACLRVLSSKGYILPFAADAELKKYNEMLSKLLKIGKRHITLLRFIDLSITVDGLHRAGQDDWDSHAKRFENRIIRMSTRRKMVPEMSDYYKDKVLTFGDAIEKLDIKLPNTIEAEDDMYIKTPVGYIKSEHLNSNDVHRGLFPLGMQSSFIFKCNLTEFAHVYKERRKEGNAHPEVKELCEEICDLLEDAQPMFTRELFMEIKN